MQFLICSFYFLIQLIVLILILSMLFICCRNSKSIIESSLICVVLLREAVDPAILSTQPLLSSFSIYKVLSPSNLAIAVQLVVMYLMSVLQLMDWNITVSLIKFYFDFLITCFQYFPFWTIQGALLGNTLGLLASKLSCHFMDDAQPVNKEQ